MRFAFANIRRRPERFVLSVLGIALAIACVTVVRTISSSFAITGADSVTDVLGDAQLWVVPAAGVHYDSEASALVADGPAPALTVPDGWRACRPPRGSCTSATRRYPCAATTKYPRGKRFSDPMWQTGSRWPTDLSST